MFRRLSKVWLLAALATLTCAQAALAWNDTGHKIASNIAWNNLKPEIRARVCELLLKHPQYAVYLEDKTAATPEEGQLSAFMTAGTWGDLVRSMNGPNAGKNRLYNHPSWHYVDYPYVVGPLPEGKTPEAPVAEWKPDTDPANNLQAIQKCEAQLADPKTSDEEKAVAMAWLMHLVEDLHQPLHAVSLYSQEFPDGDKGGNMLMVNAASNVSNLHALWDSMLGRYQDLPVVKELAAKVAKDNPRDKFAEQLKITDPKAWAQESFTLAKTVVYQNGKLPYVSSQKLRDNKQTPVPELSKEYLESAKTVASERLALSGYRLADELNRLLAPGATTAPATGAANH